jgi:4-aminobutyrate aminotransferase-like enzyme
MQAPSLSGRRNRVLGTGAALFYDEPLHLVRGDGVELFDASGQRYVDMYNNVPCVGHANPVVVEAMARQQATLNVHNRYLHEGILDFAERLTSLQHDGIESVIFSCTGTEAVENALRMARIATGKRGIVCTDATYHGSNDLVGSLTWVGRDNQETDEVRAFPYPDKYRPLAEDLDEVALGAAYLEHVRAAIDGVEKSGAGFAALIMCSILANEGLPDIPHRFMTQAAELARAAGGLVIADEVQAGYGRTGQWWGYDVTEFTPDIIVTGKPMGNGLPLAATTASRELVDKFRAGTRYFNTFSSTPLQAAVGMAVLDEIENRNLLENARKIGASLKSELDKRQRNYDIIGDVRGRGLFLGIEMIKGGGDKSPDARRAVEIGNKLKSRGFLTSHAGSLENVVKIRPPLVFSADNAAEFLVAFDDVMDNLDGW